MALMLIAAFGIYCTAIIFSWHIPDKIMSLCH